MKTLKFLLIFIVFFGLVVMGEAKEPEHSKYMLEADVLIHKSNIERGCRLYLRALGSTQLSYMDNNNMRNYGSWELLVQSGYVDDDERYSRSNIIEEYSISVFAAKVSELNVRISNSKFTIIAQPDIKDSDLSILGITEFQDVLVYSDTSSNFREWILSAGLFSLQNDKMWKPLR